MGNQDTITEESFEKAAKASGQSVQEKKEHVFEMLKEELGKQ